MSDFSDLFADEELQELSQDVSQSVPKEIPLEADDEILYSADDDEDSEVPKTLQDRIDTLQNAGYVVTDGMSANKIDDLYEQYISEFSNTASNRDYYLNAFCILTQKSNKDYKALRRSISRSNSDFKNRDITPALVADQTLGSLQVFISREIERRIAETPGNKEVDSEELIDKLRSSIYSSASFKSYYLANEKDVISMIKQGIQDSLSKSRCRSMQTLDNSVRQSLDEITPNDQIRLIKQVEIRGSSFIIHDEGKEYEVTEPVMLILGSPLDSSVNGSYSKPIFYFKPIRIEDKIFFFNISAYKDYVSYFLPLWNSKETKSGRSVQLPDFRFEISIKEFLRVNKYLAYSMTNTVEKKQSSKMLKRRAEFTSEVKVADDTLRLTWDVNKMLEDCRSLREVLHSKAGSLESESKYVEGMCMNIGHEYEDLAVNALFSLLSFFDRVSFLRAKLSLRNIATCKAALKVLGKYKNWIKSQGTLGELSPAASSIPNSIQTEVNKILSFVKKEEYTAKGKSVSEYTTDVDKSIEACTNMVNNLEASRKSMLNALITPTAIMTFGTIELDKSVECSTELFAAYIDSEETCDIFMKIANSIVINNIAHDFLATNINTLVTEKHFKAYILKGSELTSDVFCEKAKIPIKSMSLTYLVPKIVDKILPNYFEGCSSENESKLKTLFCDLYNSNDEPPVQFTDLIQANKMNNTANMSLYSIAFLEEILGRIWYEKDAVLHQITLQLLIDSRLQMCHGVGSSMLFKVDADLLDKIRSIEAAAFLDSVLSLFAKKVEDRLFVKQEAFGFVDAMKSMNYANILEEEYQSLESTLGEDAISEAGGRNKIFREFEEYVC